MEHGRFCWDKDSSERIAVHAGADGKAAIGPSQCPAANAKIEAVGCCRAVRRRCSLVVCESPPLEICYREVRRVRASGITANPLEDHEFKAILARVSTKQMPREIPPLGQI